MPRKRRQSADAVVIKAIEDAGAAVGANGLNVTLDAQLVADIKSIAPAVKAAVPRHPRAANHAARGSGNSRCVKFGRAHLAQTFTENAPSPMSRQPPP
jgi:hypothetical protein